MKLDSKKSNLLSRLCEEQAMSLKGSLYHLTQVKLCYNSNRIEGSQLSEEQTRHIFETASLLPDNGNGRVGRLEFNNQLKINYLHEVQFKNESD